MSIWSAVGGLLGTGISKWVEGKQRDVDQSRQDNQLQRLVADAKKSGISPLAALGSNVAGQYGSPVGAVDYGSAGAALGNAAGAIAGRKQSKAATALATENASLQNDLLRAQIEAIKTDTIRSARSRSIAATEANVNAPAAMDALKVAGHPITQHTGWSNTQDMEDRYGELVSLPYGVGVLAADLYRTTPAHEITAKQLSNQKKLRERIKNRINVNTGQYTGPEDAWRRATYRY